MQSPPQTFTTTAKTNPTSSPTRTEDFELFEYLINSTAQPTISNTTSTNPLSNIFFNKELNSQQQQDVPDYSRFRVHGQDKRPLPHGGGAGGRSGGIGELKDSSVGMMMTNYPSPFDSPLDIFSPCFSPSASASASSFASSSASASSSSSASSLLRAAQSQSRKSSNSVLLNTPLLTPIANVPASTPNFGVADALSVGGSPFESSSSSSVMGSPFGDFNLVSGSGDLDMELVALLTPHLAGLGGEFGGAAFGRATADGLADAAACFGDDFPLFDGMDQQMMASPLGATVGSSATAVIDRAQGSSSSSMMMLLGGTPSAAAISAGDASCASPFVSSNPSAAAPVVVSEPTVTISVADLQALIEAARMGGAGAVAAQASQVAAASVATSPASALMTPIVSSSSWDTPLAMPSSSSTLMMAGTPIATPFVGGGAFFDGSFGDLDMDMFEPLFDQVSSASADDVPRPSADTVSVKDEMEGSVPTTVSTKKRPGRKPKSAASGVPMASPLPPIVKEKQRRRPSKVYACPHPGCPRTFTRAFNLKTHIETHDPDRERKFGCDKCGARFVRVHDLQRHALVHDDVRRFGCKGCGRGFTRRDALRRHWGSSEGCKEESDEE
ncbi:hypothetical protein HDU97_000624 [Phlyctochytrium planicorne]|nr:hypothetical protein HDU97_000624 [Phlyctochytrium planicorne]